MKVTEASTYFGLTEYLMELMSGYSESSYFKYYLVIIPVLDEHRPGGKVIGYKGSLQRDYIYAQQTQGSFRLPITDEVVDTPMEVVFHHHSKINKVLNELDRWFETENRPQDEIVNELKESIKKVYHGS